MYATLLAQPVSWAFLQHLACACTPTALDDSQQRRVMPTFGGVLDTSTSYATVKGQPSMTMTLHDHETVPHCLS
jgi:hypothetical protein